MADDDGEHRLWALADLITPMAVRVVATLRIADAIGDTPRDAAELAVPAGADPDALERVLRHLAGAGVFTRDAAGRYGLTEVGRALRDDHPAALRPMFDLDSAIGRADLSFVELAHSVRTGGPAFPVRFGRSFWADLATDPGRTVSYAAQMGSDVTGDAPAITAGFDWTSLGHVVDVGGGGGALLVSLLRAHPTLRGTVLDLPDTAEVARRALAEAGLSDRGDVVAGSFFEPLPSGAGGYLLSAIIHDWADDEARAILRRCAAAAGDTGRVFVIEKIGADGESIRTGMDLRMLAYFGGRERGVTALAALGAECGLRMLATHPADDLTIIEFATQEPGG